MGAGGSELRTTVTGQFLRYAIRGKFLTQTLNQTASSISCTFDDRPVGIPIYYDEVVDTFVREKVCTDALKGKCGIDRGGGWSTRLARG